MAVVCGPHIESPMDAAVEAFLRHYKNQKLSPLVVVSERGFDYHDHHHTEDVVLDTNFVLQKAGFQIDEC